MLQSLHTEGCANKAIRHSGNESYTNNPNAVISSSRAGLWATMFYSQAQLGLQVAIESERIMKVLDRAMDELEVAVHIPSLLANDMKMLRPFLKEDELEVVAQCRVYSPTAVRRPKNEMGDVRKSNVSEKLRNDGSVPSNRMDMGFGDSAYNDASAKPGKEDPIMSSAIHMLASKPKRRAKLVRHAKMSEACSTFLESMRLLRDYIQMRFQITPNMDHLRQIELRAAYKRNEVSKSAIVDLQKKLRDQRNEAEVLLSAKKRLIEKHRSRIASLSVGFRQDSKKIVNQSEKEMVVESKNSELRKVQLSQEVKAAQTKLTALLTEHLQNEKSLRAKKYKVESQLLTWIEKYDQDVGEKQAEWDDIETGFNKETRDMAILQEEFEAQTEVYEMLMKEKEEEYNNELEAKRYIIIINRAARCIQRCWRAYLARKLARKKGRRRSGNSKTGKAAPKKKKKK